MKGALAAASVWFVFFPRAGFAQPVGTAFTYQGRLTSAGSPASGPHDLRFVLFDAAAAGSQIGPTVDRPGTSVTNGLFTVTLDFGAAAFAGSKRWLEIRVSPAGAGSYTTLSPRQELTPSPNAVFSSTAPWAGISSKPAGFADDVDNDSGGDITAVNAGGGLTGGGATGSVTLGVDLAGSGSASTVARSDHHHLGQSWSGTASPGLGISSSAASGIGVLGWATATTGENYGVWGESASTSGFGVVGLVPSLTGTTYGVGGESWSSTGRGVYGLATATTGVNYGVYGESASESGTGVRGSATATGGSANGVWGQSAAPGGNGVYGATTATTGLGFGVWGVSYSTGGRGVVGEGAALSGATIGVLGVTPSPDGVGVHGAASATSGTTAGVKGESASPAGSGVYGKVTADSGDPFAVYGIRSGSAGWAAYFVGPVGVLGNMSVTGSISKGSGSFKIDHPLDPEHKYLYHSFVESPDMMNVYNGNVTTDAEGYATVPLPDWFEALNRDFRYQLTVIADGSVWPLARVEKKIADNRFTIRTSQPRVEVSWQVTGIRKDAFAEKHRIPVEEDKPEDEQGRYLHPEAFGQPKEKGVGEGRALPPPATGPAKEPK